MRRPSLATALVSGDQKSVDKQMVWADHAEGYVLMLCQGRSDWFNLGAAEGEGASERGRVFGAERRFPAQGGYFSGGGDKPCPTLTRSNLR